MTEILIYWNDKEIEKQIEVINLIEFYNKFNIYQAVICNFEEWTNFLQENLLNINHIPKFEDSGFRIEDLRSLDRLGYVQDSECYSLDSFCFNNLIFASPYQDQITHGEHISSAFQKLLGAIELNHNCKIFYR
ncbi:MAG: hypothetical protein K2Y14_01040 [Burkholderiales bacterium]|nr:hypothetical protein [Burkholderiales bacterium]